MEGATNATDSEVVKAMRILIVEDSDPNSRALARMLDHFGHENVIARDGVEAVEMFQSWRPDLVMMDIMMPRMDGYEATRRIKALSGEHFVPVIFVTALNDNASLCKAIEAGGDDYLTKPYMLEEIGAKILAMQRIKALHEDMLYHKTQAEQHQLRQQKEMRVAEHLFNGVLDRGAGDLPGISHWVSSATVFCGDIILVSETPAGAIQMLIGDFAGHGITAAIGAMPAAEIFYGMSKKGFALERVLEEVNRKLYTALPADIFCAATALEIDPQRESISFWSGGMPPLYIVNHETSTLRGLPASHLALGVLAPEAFASDIQVLPLSGCESIVAFSDGLVRAESLDREKLGLDRISAYLLEHTKDGATLSSLQELVGEHMHSSVQLDDISILAIETARLEKHTQGEGESLQTVKMPLTWHFSLELEADSLRTLNPVPLVMNLIQEIQGLAPFRQHIFSILSELFTNALDHGVLGLDSAVKADSDGFMRYYELRKERLAGLEEGKVMLSISHREEDGDGVLEACVEDSGGGFDTASLQTSLEDNGAYSGRGLPLVQARCESLTFNDRGNAVTAEYRWQPGTAQP